MISEERLLSTFLSLVRINAPSKEERPVALYLKKRLKAYPILEDKAGVSIRGNCGNLFVRVAGDQRSPVMLCAHLDTIRPTIGIRPIVKDGIIRTDGRTILGSDDRAGIAVILELLQHFRETGQAHPPLDLVFSVAEEIGLQGTKSIDRKYLRSSRGYILDSSLPVGMAVNRSVSCWKMAVEVEGRAAHSGAQPEKGINAISIAAKALARLRTGRLSRFTTFNIGTIAGGQAVNIVPDETRVALEMRSRRLRTLQALRQRVKAVFRQAVSRNGGKVSFRDWEEFHHFYVPTWTAVAKSFARGAQAAGLKPVFRPSCEGSDANVFNGMGIPCLVLGMGYKFPHTNNEQVAVRDLVRATKLLAAVLGAVQR